MAMIDGELHEREYSMVVKLAEKLNLEKKDVDDIVKLVLNIANDGKI